MQKLNDMKVIDMVKAQSSTTEGKRGRGRPKGCKLDYKIGKDGKFTKAMEIYCQAIHDGYSQVQAYRKAFPEKVLKLANSTIVLNAFKMYHKPDVQKRLNELVAKTQEKLEEEALWKREDAVRDLKYLEDLGLNEVKRIESARAEQLQMIEEQIDDELNKEEPDLSKIRKYREEINLLKQKRLISMTQITAIKSAIDGLNSMHGYNEYNVNNNISGSGVVELEFDYGDDSDYTKFSNINEDLENGTSS